MGGESSQVTAIKKRSSLDQLLRRADWRFLLPETNPNRSVCFASEQLSQAVALVSKEVVSTGEALPSSCDLAVVSNPDGRSLKAAWEALSPGGMLYAEVYSPLAGGPPKLKERITNAGFVDTAFYFPWPLPEKRSTLFWLPLEAPEAVDYFLSNRPPSFTWGEGFTRSMMQAAWRVLQKARLLVPICITARKNSSNLPRPDSRDGDLLRVIQERWQEWGFGPWPDRLHWLMLTGGLSSINKVVKYAFAGSEPFPRLAVKHARVPESIPGLIREAESLTSLERLPGGILPNVPRLLFTKQSKKTIAVGETVIDGHPLYTRLRKENYRSLALKTTAWLLKLVNQDSWVPRSAWWPRFAEPALQAFEEKFGRGSPAIQVGCIREELRSLQALPVTFEHSDFSPWNVLVTDSGQLAVLDWEAGEPQGLPGMDLIYFLTFLAFFQEGAMSSGELLPAYRAAGNPETFTGSVQAECLQIYFNAIGLDPGLARPLRLLAWVIHCFSLFPDLGPNAGKRKAEEGYPFIGLLAEDLGGKG